MLGLEFISHSSLFAGLKEAINVCARFLNKKLAKVRLKKKNTENPDNIVPITETTNIFFFSPSSQFVAVDAGSKISFGSESSNAPYDLPFGVRIVSLPF